eukprot:5119540-Karenia_brevis.AAC.1
MLPVSLLYEVLVLSAVGLFSYFESPRSDCGRISTAEAPIASETPTAFPFAPASDTCCTALLAAQTW